MEFQTRSEVNGIERYETFKQAYDAWLLDPTIWKISINGMIYKPIKKNLEGNKQLEEKLCELSSDYEKEKDMNAIYWTEQFSGGDIIESVISNSEFKKFAKYL